MRFDVLQYLVDIDKTHSISATAERFFIAQPAVSNSIMNLEKELGVKLLKRSTHGAIPTEEGKKVIESAKKILTEWDNIGKSVKGEDYDASATNEILPVNILCGSCLTNILMPKMLDIVDKKYPYIDISLEHTDSLKYFGKKIYDGKFDIYLVSLNKKYFESLIPQINEENMSVINLADDHLGVCISNKFLYADKNEIDFQEKTKLKGCSFGFLPMLSTKVGTGINLQNSEIHKNIYCDLDCVRLLSSCQDIDFYKRIMNQNTVLTLPHIGYEAYFKNKKFQWREFKKYDNRMHDITHAILYREKATDEVRDIVEILRDSFRVS